jgi:hypothetical protein
VRRFIKYTLLQYRVVRLKECHKVSFKFMG